MYENTNWHRCVATGRLLVIHYFVTGLTGGKPLKRPQKQKRPPKSSRKRLEEVEDVTALLFTADLQDTRLVPHELASDGSILFQLLLCLYLK